MLSKNFIFLWVAFLACVTYVSATLSITDPVQGTVWNAGQSENVAWTGTSNTTTVTLVLRRGDPNALTTVATIGTNINPSSSSVKYTVPDNIVSGNDYTVGIGTDPDYNYSHTFTINGASNSNSTTTGSTSTSTSASSSASDFTSTVTATSTLKSDSTTRATTSTGSLQPKSGATASTTSKPTIPSSVSSRVEFPSLMSLSISAISLALSIAVFLIR